VCRGGLKLGVGGVAKRADLNELDVPEWAALALDKVEWRKLLQRMHRPLASRDGDSEPQAERND
jgi:hypothetical protein